MTMVGLAMVSRYSTRVGVRRAASTASGSVASTYSTSTPKRASTDDSSVRVLPYTARVAHDPVAGPQLRQQARRGWPPCPTRTRTRRARHAAARRHPPWPRRWGCPIGRRRSPDGGRRGCRRAPRRPPPRRSPTDRWAPSCRPGERRVACSRHGWRACRNRAGSHRSGTWPNSTPGGRVGGPDCLPLPRLARPCRTTPRTAHRGTRPSRRGCRWQVGCPGRVAAPCSGARVSWGTGGAVVPGGRLGTLCWRRGQWRRRLGAGLPGGLVGAGSGVGDRTRSASPVPVPVPGPDRRSGPAAAHRDRGHRRSRRPGSRPTGSRAEVPIRVATRSVRVV